MKQISLNFLIPRPLPSPAELPHSSDLREVSVAPQETRHYNVSGLAVSPHNLTILPRTTAGISSQSFSLLAAPTENSEKFQITKQ